MAEFTAEDRNDLALVLKGLLLKYDALFGFSFPYLMVVHQAPTDGGELSPIIIFILSFILPTEQPKN